MQKWECLDFYPGLCLTHGSTKHRHLKYCTCHDWFISVVLALFKYSHSRSLQLLGRIPLASLRCCMGHRNKAEDTHKTVKPAQFKNGRHHQHICDMSLQNHIVCTQQGLSAGRRCIEVTETCYTKTYCMRKHKHQLIPRRDIFVFPRVNGRDCWCRCIRLTPCHCLLITYHGVSLLQNQTHGYHASQSVSVMQMRYFSIYPLTAVYVVCINVVTNLRVEIV